jgi:cyclomaltodextrinase
MILKEALYHRPHRNWAYAYDRDTICLRIRTQRNDKLSVECWAGDKYAWEQTQQFYPMQLIASDELFHYWEMSIKPAFHRLFYCFRIQAQDELVWLTDHGVFVDYTNMPWRNYEFPFIHESNIFSPPTWVKDAVFYQIFPDRFANGDESNDPAHVETWGGQPTYTNFFGGDLEGVLNKLDYLVELGINAIYFTPIFLSPSNHKYDTIDYFQVDPQFGTTEKLKELVNACHQRGVRVMLDAVFNHSGFAFPPFVDVLDKGEQSAYRDWFHIRKFPLEVVDGIPTYHTFAFSSRMPKFNTSNPQVRAYLLDVARYWIEEVGIDGWRLDVANEVEHSFWRDFRQVVKSLKSDAYILGEVWHDAMPWLEGDQFDASMNYPLTNALLDFFARQVVDGKGFADLIGNNLGRFQRQVHEVAFNIIDSHDTERILTLLNGDKQMLKLAALFQFTYLGTPCIYYGTEIGLDGGFDPDCRKCMIWNSDAQDHDLFAHYQWLISLRKSNKALRDGSFRFLAVKDRCVAYERSEGDRIFVILMNAAGSPEMISSYFEVDVIPGVYKDIQRQQDYEILNGSLQLELKAYDFYVLEKL